jgi:purine-binding chemotaxis protein CheW
MQDSDTILRARAEALALPPVFANERNNELELVRFQLNNESYAFETKYVWRLNRLPHVTLIPMISGTVSGICNMHGSVIAMLNLKKILGLHESEEEPVSKVVIALGRRAAEIAVTADCITGIWKIDPCELQPAPEGLSFSSKFISGICKPGITVLDPEKLWTAASAESDQNIDKTNQR